jgi:hypothetical protein
MGRRRLATGQDERLRVGFRNGGLNPCRVSERWPQLNTMSGARRTRIEAPTAIWNRQSGADDGPKYFYVTTKTFSFSNADRPRPGARLAGFFEALTPQMGVGPTGTITFEADGKTITQVGRPPR